MATNPEALAPIPPPNVHLDAASNEKGQSIVPTAHNHVYQYDDYDEEIQGEYPTEEEFHTLRRVADKVPWMIYTIAFVELCERFSYYGTTVVCRFIFTF
jgi:POT family proton-dependent oligopeptide transporter